MKQFQCCHCGKFKSSNPRIKKQNYCSKPECQRARKSEWQRNKMQTDKDYQLNQKSCNERWKKANPGYWKEYRNRKPDKGKRNKTLQTIRNKRNTFKNMIDSNMDGSSIAKMDALTSSDFNVTGEFWLVPVIAKMDASRVIIRKISKSYV